MEEQWDGGTAFLGMRLMVASCATSSGCYFEQPNNKLSVKVAFQQFAKLKKVKSYRQIDSYNTALESFSTEPCLKLPILTSNFRREGPIWFPCSHSHLYGLPLHQLEIRGHLLCRVDVPPMVADVAWVQARDLSIDSCKRLDCRGSYTQSPDYQYLLSILQTSGQLNGSSAARGRLRW